MKINLLTRYRTRAKKYLLVYDEFKFDGGEIFGDVGKICADVTIEIKGGYIDAGATTARDVLAIAFYAVEGNPGYRFAAIFQFALQSQSCVRIIVYHVIFGYI